MANNKRHSVWLICLIIATVRIGFHQSQVEAAPLHGFNGRTVISVVEVLVNNRPKNKPSISTTTKETTISCITDEITSKTEQKPTTFLTTPIQQTTQNNNIQRTKEIPTITIQTTMKPTTEATTTTTTTTTKTTQSMDINTSEQTPTKNKTSKLSPVGPCATVRDSMIEYTNMMAKLNILIQDMTLPSCTSDGYYSPMQCIISGCNCVSRDGVQLEKVDFSNSKHCLLLREKSK